MTPEAKPHIIETKFTIRDKVMVTEIQRPAVIDLIQIDASGVSYCIVLWDNGERKEVWVYEDEIQKR